MAAHEPFDVPDRRESGELSERLADPRRAVTAAREHIAAAALRSAAPSSPERRVGLELEFHLVDLPRPAQRPRWARVQELVASLPELPSRSRVTVEPGGQVELSTPPACGVASAVGALEADRKLLAETLAESGYGLAALGTDLARPVRRINPAERYVAMEAHFVALRCARAGKAMMSATAALQVNLDAGPPEAWSQRLSRLRDLGPVLVAISACSPLLAGRRSGWHSMRQQAWHGIDARRGQATAGADPVSSWAEYALHAPVMLVQTSTGCRPVTRRLPLEQWLDGSAALERRPTRADLDYHLTTLFPPIRLRGYIELRCLDAVPGRWWQALAGIVATLVDDDTAADRAAECCEPVRERWLEAAREGLADPQLAAAARSVTAIAAERCPAELRSDVADYAELIACGRTPGDAVRERVAAVGALATMTEYAHA